MTQDMDILSPRAAELAEEIRSFLHDRFKIAARVRSVKDGIGFRIYQSRKPKNRHLVDVRAIIAMPIYPTRGRSDGARARGVDCKQSYCFGSTQG
jgi:hypothetical protein